MIVATDLHLHEDSEAVVFGEVLPGLEAAMLEHGDNEITLLGDLLSTRYRVHSRHVIGFYDRVKAWTQRGWKVRILPGNHDMHDLAGRTILELLEGVAQVFREPAYDTWGTWIPYQALSEKFIQAVSTVVSREFLWIHQGIKGAWMNDNMQDTDGVSVEAVSGFLHVFSGHYHRHHSFANVTYVGTPYQTRADEAGQVKGYVFVDKRQKIFSHVPKVWGPRYVHMEIADPRAVQLAGLRPNDIVRATVADGINLEKLAEKFVAAGIKNHTLTPEIVHSEARLEVGAAAGMSEYAQAYVDKFATEGMDKARLLALFKEVIE